VPCQKLVKVWLQSGSSSFSTLAYRRQMRVIMPWRSLSIVSSRTCWVNWPKSTWPTWESQCSATSLPSWNMLALNIQRLDRQLTSRDEFTLKSNIYQSISVCLSVRNSIVAKQQLLNISINPIWSCEGSVSSSIHCLWLVMLQLVKPKFANCNMTQLLFIICIDCRPNF